MAAKKQDSEREDGVSLSLVAERHRGAKIFFGFDGFLKREASHAELIVGFLVIGSFYDRSFKIVPGSFRFVAGIKFFLPESPQAF